MLRWDVRLEERQLDLDRVRLSFHRDLVDAPLSTTPILGLSPGPLCRPWSPVTTSLPSRYPRSSCLTPRDQIQSSEWLQVRGLEIKPYHPDFTVLPHGPDHLAVGIIQKAD